MHPSQFILKQNLIPALAGDNRRDVVAELLERLVSTGAVKVEHRDEILHELQERENKGSTAIGFEIAIPHCKTDHVSELAVAVGLHPTGIPWNANDRKGVRICILTLSTKKVTGPHLQFMATICNILKDDRTRSALLAATTVDGMDEMIRKGS